MAENSSSTPHQCPSCHDNFSSLRALMIHLNSCKGIFTQNATAPSHKRPPALLTIVQHADEIFKSIKRPHTSGHRVNDDRLSVNPSLATAAAAMISVRSIDVNDDSLDGSDIYDTGSDFYMEQENNGTSDGINNASNDRYKYRSGLNPPPGVKFGVHLQHVISSHRGVDLKFCKTQTVSQKRIDQDAIKSIQSW